MSEKDNRAAAELDWKEIEALWQRHDVSLNAEDLARRARGAGLRMRLFVAAETLLAFFGVAVGGYLIFAGGLSGIIFGAVVASYSAWALWVNFQLRQGTWAAESKTAEALLELQIRRARAAIRYVELNLKSSPVALLFAVLGLWVIADAHRGWSSPAVARAAILYAFILLAFAVFLLGLTVYRKRKRKELENLIRIRGQFNGD